MENDACFLLKCGYRAVMPLIVVAAACEPPPTLTIAGRVRLIPPDCVEHEPARDARQLVDLSLTGPTTPAVGLVLASGTFPHPENVTFSESRVWFAGAPAGFPASQDDARVWRPEPTLRAIDMPTLKSRPWLGVHTLSPDERTALSDSDATESVTAMISVAVFDEIEERIVYSDNILAVPIDFCAGCLALPCVQTPPCISGQDEAFGPRCFSPPD